jgi:hypothetical protein
VLALEMGTAPAEMTALHRDWLDVGLDYDVLPVV